MVSAVEQLLKFLDKAAANFSSSGLPPQAFSYSYGVGGAGAGDGFGIRNVQDPPNTVV